MRAALWLCLTLGLTAASLAQSPPTRLPDVFVAPHPVASTPVASWGSASFQPAGSGALFIGQGPVAYHSVSIAVDAAGGQHTAYVHYAGGEGGAMPVYYAYCPAAMACDDATAWQRVTIGTNETFVQLALTPEGRPRVLMHHETLATPWGGGETTYRYAECDADCTTESGWHSVQVLQNAYGGSTTSADYAPHSFALDPQGRPRFVHQQALGSVAAYYVGCDAACTDATQWWQRRLPLDHFGDGLKRSAFTISADGAAHLLTTVFLTLTTEALVYLSCPATCTTPADWQVSAPLLDISGNDTHRTWTLAADALGRPRFVLTYSNTTAYAWCDADCDEGANWYAQQLTFGARPIRYPALRLDAQSRPRLAFQEMEHTGLGYAWCTGACETDAADWRYGLAEDDDLLDQQMPIAPLGGCTPGAWYGGYRPALALDAQGNPYLAYDAEHLMPCYRDPQHPEYGSDTKARWWTSRIVYFPQPDVSTPTTPVEPTPAGLRLDPAVPNPSRSQVTLTFWLPEAGPVLLALYDPLGRQVALLVDGVLPSGDHRVQTPTSALAAGVYVAVLLAGGQRQSQVLTRVK